MGDPADRPGRVPRCVAGLQGPPVSADGITDPALLRASHIVPWSDCNDDQRLDVHNGLLLSALWDATFDQGLVSFADDGAPL
jgi:hypothetical protein